MTMASRGNEEEVAGLWYWLDKLPGRDVELCIGIDNARCLPFVCGKFLWEWNVGVRIGPALRSAIDHRDASTTGAEEFGPVRPHIGATQ